MDSKFLNIDVIILILTIMSSLFYSRRLEKGAAFPINRLALFFFVFGPMTIFLNMIAHNAEIAYQSILKIINGTFTYNYRFYSLIFMGVVFILISGFMIDQVKQWSKGDTNAKSGFVKASVLMIVLSLPTVVFTPIGSLPTMACVVSLIALKFSKKTIVMEAL